MLGDPDLYKISAPIHRDELREIDNLEADLHDTMMDFKARYGRGRAIAAPQIGVFKKAIYMNIDKPLMIINPQLTDLSKEMIEIWDDCMSFPDLIVKVKRYKSCKITFYNKQWQQQSIPLVGDLSELLQHEYDHLDGILAVQRAIDSKSFALQSQKDKIK